MTQKSITVKALRSFDHQGRVVSTGETVDVTPVEAAILGKHRYINLSQHSTHADAEPELVVEQLAVEPPKRKRGRPKGSRNRTYQTRDMVAKA